MTHYPPHRNDGKHVFVFGSNLSGRHGKGAALTARKHWGALQGAGYGPTGHAYAIPTKNERLETRPLNAIALDVLDFIMWARAHPDLTFLVTPIGTGLAGYRHDQIAPMFKGAPANCVLPEEWKEWA